jgi:hypothetical protein
MKKYMKAFRTLTVLIIALAALTACSSDNEVLNNQPVNPTESKTYTMTVQLFKDLTLSSRVTTRPFMQA